MFVGLLFLSCLFRGGEGGGIARLKFSCTGFGVKGCKLSDFEILRVWRFRASSFALVA